MSDYVTSRYVFWAITGVSVGMAAGVVAFFVYIGTN